MAKRRKRSRRPSSSVGPWAGPLLATAVVGYLWFGPVTPVVIAVGAGAITLWLLFAAPAICGVEGRDGRCRNNAVGWLRGCWLRQHKWQKLRLVAIGPTWKKLTHGLWHPPAQALATTSTLLSILTMVRGLIAVWLA